MGNCKDCKHWESFDDYWEKTGQLHYDSPDEIDAAWGKRRYGSCLIAESDGANPLNPETKAFAIDGEHYIGELQTAPDFGCNQFAKKGDS